MFLRTITCCHFCYWEVFLLNRASLLPCHFNEVLTCRINEFLVVTFPLDSDTMQPRDHYHVYTMFLLWRSSNSLSDDVLWPRNFLQHNNRNQAYDFWFTLVSRCLVKEIVERVRGGIVSLEFVVLQHFVSKSISNVKELVVFVFWYGLV